MTQNANTAFSMLATQPGPVRRARELHQLDALWRAFHGDPWLIHRLTYRRTNHKNLHVRGYEEEGTTSTPFDVVVRNDLDRFHLVEDVIDRVPRLGARAAYFKQAIRDKLIEHQQYIEKHGEDMPDITGWRWSQERGHGASRTSTEADNV